MDSEISWKGLILWKLEKVEAFLTQKLTKLLTT